MFVISSVEARCYFSEESESGFRNESGWQVRAVFGTQPGGKQGWEPGYDHRGNKWSVMPRYSFADVFDKEPNDFNPAYLNYEDTGTEKNEVGDRHSALSKQIGLRKDIVIQKDCCCVRRDGKWRESGTWKDYRETQYKETQPSA